MVPEIPYRHTVPETPDFPIPSIPFRNPQKSYTVIPHTYVSRLLQKGLKIQHGEPNAGIPLSYKTPLKTLQEAATGKF